MAITHPATRLLRLLCLAALTAAGAFALPAGAQQKPPVAPPMPRVPPPPKPGRPQIRRSVDLVVLPVTVVDKHGKFVEDLKQNNFHVYEDGVEQKIAVFKREDIPVTMGLVIDNSASMKMKRPSVNAAALTMVQTSNRDDEVFVVNFNEDYYLDQPSDFTNNLGVLKDALERIESRGSTALYDAILASLDHLKKGHRDKKVLLVVTDGEDNSSKHDLEDTVRAAQQSDAVIYTIGLLSDEDHGAARRSKRALTALSEATGGLAFFPKTVDEVHSICLTVAKDIRNQYLVGYYPTKPQSAGGYRRVEVKLKDVPHRFGKLDVRTRTGYYPKTSPAGASQANQ